ncbi:hypothetical protein V6N13_009795 [Hibiscus sabdariffa]|uniref:Uncharacterized protein n=1 Tax=Hibiscus sabdariffa TaxID=183260 RepID=A0ABR2B9B9_9ROSI
MLATKVSLDEWKRDNGSRGKGTMEVLALSYDDLPAYLIPCFLYLSHYRENYVIEAQRLIELWVAEGIVSSKEEGDADGEWEVAEDVAELYLMELAARQKKDNFLFVVDESNASSTSTMRKIRRISALKCFETQRIECPNLRSLSFFNPRSSLEELFEVPDVIWRMVQLRHLYLPKHYTNNTKLKLDTLTNLQTLVNFNTDKCYVEDLINMTNLKQLEIRGPFKIEDFNELDENPPIIQAKYLHSLTIISEEEEIDPRHLNHLLSSCATICKLTLSAKISKLPELRYLSSNLAYIHLAGCKLEEDPMPTLEQLPNLRVLELNDGAFLGNSMFCSAQGFPKLESLSLMRFYSLEQWEVDEGAMPFLERLEIIDCSHLDMNPIRQRFNNILREGTD